MSLEGIKKGVLRTLRDTPIEIALLGCIGLGSLWYVGHTLEVNRSRNLPLAFSERSAIDDHNAKKGLKTSEEEAHYAGLHDFVNKINESSNTAWSKTDNPKEAHIFFAQDLEERMFTHERSRRNLKDFSNQVPKHAKNLLNDLKPITKAAQALDPALNHFKQTWDYSTDDHYDTITETTTDADGNETTTTREEYSHTTHHFTFNKGHGIEALAALQKTNAEHGHVSYTIRMWTSPKVGKENKEAIDSSHKGSEDFTPVDYALLASTWQEASKINKNHDLLRSPFTRMFSGEQTWRSEVHTARSHKYDTTSRTDAGPREYQTVERIIGDVSHFQNGIFDIDSGLISSIQRIPQIEDKISQIIDHAVFMEHGVGRDVDKKVKQLYQEIMTQTRLVYAHNFEDGLDIDGYRWWMVGLFALLGAAAGAGLGFGWDLAAQRGGWYHKHESIENKFGRVKPYLQKA